MTAICRQQNVPIQGHTDDCTHFQALLKYCAKGDELLNQYAETNAKYRSHQFQNELIEICGKQIQDEILHKCRDAKWFSPIG